MFAIIRQRRTFLFAMAAAVCAVLCCGCSDNGIGGAFVIARNGGNNDCGKDGTAGSCKTVKIGDQTWMAENLNYTPSSGNSWCYDNKESGCNMYGRLYDWSTAMGIITSYNSNKWGGSDVKHRGICPEGWHIPNNQEWTTLVDYVGGSSVAGKKLKLAYGWKGDHDGTDDYGFSALPGGIRIPYGDFNEAGRKGFWWAATEYGTQLGDFSYADYLHIDYNEDRERRDNSGNHSNYHRSKSDGYSVRCVKDD